MFVDLSAFWVEEIQLYSSGMAVREYEGRNDLHWVNWPFNTANIQLQWEATTPRQDVVKSFK